jgi:hypothetical protein
LKTRFHKAQNLAVAFAVNDSNSPEQVQLRAIVQGLSKGDLQTILKGAESKFKKGFLHWAITSELISIVLENNAGTTKEAIKSVNTPPLNWETNDAILTEKEIHESPEKWLQLENLRTGTQYILNLLDHIKSDADSDRKVDFEPNLNSKFTAVSQKYEIERSINGIEKFLSTVALKAQVDAGRDSSSMKAISALTLAFLPATFATVSIYQVLGRTV